MDIDNQYERIDGSERIDRSKNGSERIDRS